MTTSKMQNLLDKMNKYAIYHANCIPDFATLVDSFGDCLEETYGDDDDLFVDELLTKGIATQTPDLEVLVCDMNMGQCHKNVLLAKGEGETIFTGYAQVLYPDGSGGDWFAHSWLVTDTGTLVETFSEQFPCYFGTPVTGELLEKFTAFAEVAE